MAHRSAFYADQKINSAELTQAFSDEEVALGQIVSDLSPGGWIRGGRLRASNASPNAYVYVDGPCLGYTDLVGYRLYTANTFEIDPFVSGDSDVNEAGPTDGTAISLPSAGNEKWVSIAIIFERLNTDPRVHPVNGDRHFFRRLEAIKFRIVEGTEAASGLAARPDLSLLTQDDGDDGLLIGDILLTSSTTTISSSDISLSRVKTFSWSVLETFNVTEQTYAWRSDWWPGNPIVNSPTAHNGKWTFSDYQDNLSYLQITRVRVAAKERGVTYTTPTVIEFSKDSGFADADDFTVTLTASGAETDYEVDYEVPDFKILCNLVTNESPIYWRFQSAGDHQDIQIEVEYARVTT